MPEENEDDQAHDRHLEQELVPQVVDRALDEVGAVVGGDDTHAGGKRGLDLQQSLADPPDHLPGVFPMAHDHDPAHGVAEAVQVGHPAHVRAEADLGHVPQEDGRAPVVGLEHDLLQVLRGAEVALLDDAPLPGELDEAAPHLFVAAPHRLRHLHDPEAVGPQPIGVDRHLVLLGEAPEGRHRTTMAPPHPFVLM